MKKMLSLFAFAALIATVGCAKKQQTKAVLPEQEEIVMQETTSEEAMHPALTDKKEDYTIVE